MDLSQRIVTRFLNAALGDPADFLQDFGKVLEDMVIPDQTIQRARKALTDIQAKMPDPNRNPYSEYTEEYQEASRVAYQAYGVIVHGRSKLAEPGHKLFLSILQTLTLPPPLRKKVEMASRDYIREPGKPRVTARGIFQDLARLDVYDKAMGVLGKHFLVAREAIAKGQAHTSEGEGATKIKVGSFTLINTGGFPAEMMQNIGEIVGKAESLLRANDFGEICYGDVQVTNTIHKANVAAFYLIAADELYIRANVYATKEIIHSVLHELGHRFENKKLHGRKRDIERLYRLIDGQESDQRWTSLKSRIPPKGEEITDKGQVWSVVQTLPTPRGFKVHLETVSEPRVRASVTLEGYLAFKGEDARNVDETPDYQGFVSDYAKSGGPSENFAEMFAFFCMSRLPVLQSVAFEALCFGSGPGEAIFTAQRV